MQWGLGGCLSGAPASSPREELGVSGILGGAEALSDYGQQQPGVPITNQIEVFPPEREPSNVITKVLWLLGHSMSLKAAPRMCSSTPPQKPRHAPFAV